MKQITAEDVRKLREETGEGLMACKKILLERAAQEEKGEILAKVRELSFTDRQTERLVKEILTYLVRKV
jgi:translation elongation factor EF-Ts